MPLNVKMLAEFVADLQGIVPEPSRTLICRRLSALIATTLKKDDPDKYRRWLEHDRLVFARECELTCEDRWVPDDLHVEATELARFCDKWMSVEAFRLKNDPNADWQPISPEQNALRVTMINELKALAKRQ